MSGLVFNDFNTNGRIDTDPNAGAVDVGVGGLTVRAFTGTDTLVATAVTAANGTYTLNLPDTGVRLELSVVRPWWPTRQLSGLRSDVQFVDASSDQTDVNFGVHRLSEFSVDPPILFWAAQWAGSPDASATQNPNVNNFAIRGAPYSEKRAPSSVQTWSQLDTRIGRATFARIGTVFGLAMDQSTGDLYAGAYQKRFAGLKDRRTGAIYRITPGGDVSVFANISALTGTDPHPTHPDPTDWIQCDPASSGYPANCDTSWDKVGKIGLGSVVIDPQDQNLYTINLDNKTLVRFPLHGGAARVRARAAAVQPAHTTDFPVPECPGGESNWRPFAAGFDRVDGQLYVGGVCSAENAPDRANLRAIVYRVDNPLSATPDDFVEVLNFPLDYQRAPTNHAHAAFCNRWGAVGAGQDFCNWQPWPTTATFNGRPPTSAANTVPGPGAPSPPNFSNLRHPSYPLLSAITFASDGSMILGFRDLIGDMSGTAVPGEIGRPGQVAGSPMARGDLLRAAPNPNGGGFTLERNGTVPELGLVSAGQPGNWTLGAGVGPGNPGGYFYDPRALTNGDAPHPYQGGLTQIPGFADVVVTSIHVKTDEANGLLWKRNTTGASTAALENFVTPPADGNHFPGFAKSNGLGDIAAFTGLAPVQIGNRLWYDENKNGIQDADERPVTDAVVELLDCAGRLVDATRTDSVGEYVFAVDADKCYRVRVPLDQPQLDGWVPTQAFADNHAHPFIDSNGRVENGRSVAFVPGHGTGENNHTYDFGFHRPPPEVPNGEAPADEPQLGGRLALIKHRTSRSGSTLRFTIVVRNGGPGTMTNVRVCDTVPAGLEFVSASASGRRVNGRQVCWSFASLTSGEQQVLRLTARVRGPVPSGGIRNCALGTARGARQVRACATTRGAQLPSFTG